MSDRLAKTVAMNLPPRPAANIDALYRHAVGVQRILEQINNSVPVGVAGGGFELGKLMDVETGAVLDTEAPIYNATTGLFEFMTPSGMAGMIDLDDINDVNAPTPADGEFLHYDTGTSKYILSDNPVSTEIPQWSGSQWVMTAPATIGGGIELNDLGDVNTSGVLTNDVIRFDGQDWVDDTLGDFADVNFSDDPVTVTGQWIFNAAQSLDIGPVNGVLGRIRFYETTGGNNVTFRAPASLAADTTIQFPPANPVSPSMAVVSSTSGSWTYDSISGIDGAGEFAELDFSETPVSDITGVWTVDANWIFDGFPTLNKGASLLGSFQLRGFTSANPGICRLYEALDNGSNYLGLRGPDDATETFELMFPPRGADNSGEVLISDGAGLNQEFAWGDIGDIHNAGEFAELDFSETPGSDITGDWTITGDWDCSDLTFASPTSKTSTDPTTVTLNDRYTEVDTASANVTMTLPTASSSTGRAFTFKKSSASNSMVIDGNGSETIDGATTKTFTAQYDTITVWSDGTEWWISAMMGTPS